MGLSEDHLVRLAPWLEERGPNDQGEWGMYCPFHDDHKRSASLNIERNVFYCHTCGLTYSLRRLIGKIRRGDYINVRGVPNNRIKAPEPLEDARVPGWAGALLGNRDVLQDFQRRRGIDRDILARYQIGWDRSTQAYTIPVYDEREALVNIRRYSLNPGERRKIWSVAGHGNPVLYPLAGWQAWQQRIILCEGEWDALLTIQHGYSAVTRTGAAKTWKAEWCHYFAGHDVYLCHDMDTPGQAANRLVAESLVKMTNCRVFIVTLPYPITPKDGKDLTDYWQEGHTTEDFELLLATAKPYGETLAVADDEILEVSVLDSFNPEYYGKSLRMEVTVVGKNTTQHIAPHEVIMTCDQLAGPNKCQVCPMGPNGKFNGTAALTLRADDPVLLYIPESTDAQVLEVLRAQLGAEPCRRLVRNEMSHHSMDVVLVRPSVNFSSAKQVAFVDRNFWLVDSHATLANSTVEVVGAVHANPRNQKNEFLAWEIEHTRTNVDYFILDETAKRRLAKFQVRGTQTPLQKAFNIAHELSEHVTHIYERDDMHVFMDLVWHSIVNFPFMGRPVEKGWLEGLVVGDTRTGKSEIATVLTRYYGAGEFVSFESATLAGVLGGVQQIGGKEWTVTWGAIPLNDRRLVALDEISGVEPVVISQLSALRSSGVAQVTKIRSESTAARTRLLWMSNPRGGRAMREFTYGIQAIPPLIGNNEDIARFDMAMSVYSDEVATEVPNIERNKDTASRRYPSAACRTLVNWAWTRTLDDIKWSPGAEDAVLAAAKELGATYREDPPLVQGANVRFKIARIAVALAARTCSTDANFQHVIVTKAHVDDAVEFLDMIYGNQNFGYKTLSDEYAADKRKALEGREPVWDFIRGYKGLNRFLRQSHGRFRSNDLVDMMNVGKDEANSIINKLYEHRMIRRVGPSIVLTAELQDLIRRNEE